MSTVKSGIEWGKRICGALGLDTDRVSRIALDCDSRGGPVMIQIEMVGDARLDEIDWEECARSAEVEIIKEER